MLIKLSAFNVIILIFSLLYEVITDLTKTTINFLMRRQVIKMLYLICLYTFNYFYETVWDLSRLLNRLYHYLIVDHYPSESIPIIEWIVCNIFKFVVITIIILYVNSIEILVLTLFCYFFFWVSMFVLCVFYTFISIFDDEFIFMIAYLYAYSLLFFPVFYVYIICLIFGESYLE